MPQRKPRVTGCAGLPHSFEPRPSSTLTRSEQQSGQSSAHTEWRTSGIGIRDYNVAGSVIFLGLPMDKIGLSSLKIASAQNRPVVFWVFLRILYQSEYFVSNCLCGACLHKKKETINETNSCRYYPRHGCSCRGCIHNNFEGPPGVHCFFRKRAAAFMPTVLRTGNLIAKVKICLTGTRGSMIDP